MRVMRKYVQMYEVLARQGMFLLFSGIYRSGYVLYVFQTGNCTFWHLHSSGRLTTDQENVCWCQQTPKSIQSCSAAEREHGFQVFQEKIVKKEATKEEKEEEEEERKTFHDPVLGKHPGQRACYLFSKSRLIPQSSFKALACSLFTAPPPSPSASVCPWKPFFSNSASQSKSCCSVISPLPFPPGAAVVEGDEAVSVAEGGRAVGAASVGRALVGKIEVKFAR
jgi:hypothetical protein